MNEIAILLSVVLIALVVCCLVGLFAWIWDKHDKKQQLLIKRATHRHLERIERQELSK